MRVLLNINVVLDVLLARQPWFPVKVIEIFGNDATQALDVEVR